MGIRAHAQDVQPGEVIKVDANLVSIPVIVSDRDGRYLPGLTQQDFTVFDNGVEQPITFFDNTEAPLNVALLLDTSRSTEGVLDKIKDAAKDFVKKLRPQDRAMIVSFDWAIHRLSEMTGDHKVLENAIKHAEVGEYIGTLLNDAVVEVINHDMKPIVGRKAIILLTDGEDAGSYLSESGLLSYAAEADTMIYSISYPSGQARFRQKIFSFPGPGDRRGRGGRGGGIFGGGFPGRGRFPQPDRFPQPRPDNGDRRDRIGRRGELAAEFLTELANTTGGRFYRSEVTDLKKTFELIADELRHQYRLGFYPETPAEGNLLHTLRVKVDRPDTAVRARGFYRTARLPLGVTPTAPSLLVHRRQLRISWLTFAS